MFEEKIRWRRHRATATLMCKNVDHAAECTDAQAKIPARRGGRTYSLLLGDPPREVSEVECVQRVTGDTDMADSKGYTTTEADARRLLARNSPTYTSRRNVVTGSEDLHCDATVYISPWKVICCQPTYIRV